MTVLIHALGATMGGGLRHLSAFLPALGRVDRQRRYIVLVRDSIPPVATAENITLRRIPDAKAAGWVSRVVGDVVRLPLSFAGDRISTVVSLTNFGPIWSPVPHIIFQRNPNYYCPYTAPTDGARQRLELALRRRLAVESMKRAALVITPSDAMRQMIRDRCPAVATRPFRTIYHGFSARTMDAKLDPSLERVMASATGAKLLYPTHAAGHKGFEVLFDMLASLKRRGVAFTFFTTVSEADWPAGVARYRARIQQLDLQDQVVLTGRVPQSQMGAVLSQADLIVYPSLCESFGFSMIEAMGHGTPIVAAGTAVNREICGAGAAYYPPLDAQAGADTVVAALDAEASARLRAAGASRFASFDWGWDRYAREFVEAVDSVA